MRKALIITAVLTLLLPSFPLMAYEEIEVKEGAAIKGEALFKGEVPPPKKFLVTKNRDVCGNEKERQEIVATDDGRLLQVVVYLEKVKRGKPWGDAPDTYLMNQEDCSFKPYLQAVRRKSNLEVLNSDPVMHNIHTYELIGRARRSLFNVGQPGKGDKFTKQILTSRGNIVKVQCDAHDFMLGWMFVARSPYYSIVDDKGSFEIRGIPPGTYKLKAWHPFLGTKTMSITLAANAEEVINLEFE